MMREWIRKRLGTALAMTTLWLGLGAGTAIWAQAPPNPALPKITYTKNNKFHLPVQMDPGLRGNLREVCLYVKVNGGDWIRHETGLPSTQHFLYNAPRDGEYWFNLATVDKSGKMTPADLAKEPPALRVVVDTQAPSVDTQSMTNADGEFCVRFVVQDAHFDPKGLKVAFRTPLGDKTWEPVAGDPMLFKVTDRQVLEHPVKVSATDQCGNTTSRDVNVKEMLVATLSKEQAVRTVSATGEPKAAPTPPALPMEPSKLPDFIKSEALKPALPPAIVDKPGAVPTPNAPPLPPVNPTREQGSVPGGPTAPVMPPTVPETSANVAPVSAAAGRLMLNTTRAVIDYRIDQVGPSGISRVDVYLTSDAGQQWQRIQEDVDRKSPVELDLPGEGVFGIRLAITNGNGFGGTAPAKGEAPTCTIEVDTTSPFVQLRPLDPPQSGMMEIRWSASDKNLGAEPVSLFYRTRADGPWQVVARNMKNDAMFRWSFPKDQGHTFFFKVEVTDLAGNVGRAETANPIILDLTEPRAAVLGVTGAPVIRPASAQGNN